MNPTPTPRSTRQQATRFVALSALSFVSYLGISAALHELLRIPPSVAVLTALVCVTAMNFCTLRLFVFERSTAGWGSQLAGFLASIAVFRVAEYVVFLLLCGLLKLPYLPAFALVLIVSLVCKFLFLRGLVFARPVPAAPRAEVAA